MKRALRPGRRCFLMLFFPKSVFFCFLWGFSGVFLCFFTGSAFSCFFLNRFGVCLGRFSCVCFSFCSPQRPIPVEKFFSVGFRAINTFPEGNWSLFFWISDVIVGGFFSEHVFWAACFSREPPLPTF